MDVENTRLILNTIRVNYPQSFKNMDADEKKALLNLWCKAFEKLPYNVVEQAVFRIISSDDREFAPNIAQVKAKVNEMLAPDTDEKAIHAWEELRKFIRSTSIWSTKEEELPMYNRLDSVTKRLYTYREAKSLAQLSSDTLDYRRSEFIRIYKQLTYKRNEELLNEGRLVELADGTDRLRSLGYSSGEVMQIASSTEELPQRDIKGVIGYDSRNENDINMNISQRTVI